MDWRMVCSRRDLKRNPPKMKRMSNQKMKRMSNQNDDGDVDGGVDGDGRMDSMKRMKSSDVFL